MRKEVNGGGWLSPEDASFSTSVCPSRAEFILQHFSYHAECHELVVCASAQEAVLRLESLYQAHTEDLEEALRCSQVLEQVLTYQRGTYPYLGIFVENIVPKCQNAHAMVSKPGFYGMTLTRPDLFSDYLLEQLQSLVDHAGAVLVIGKSKRLIPISFLQEKTLLRIQAASGLQSLLTLPSLQDIDDAIANGLGDWEASPIRPLSLFSAERVDYSLARLKHYCGTSVEHFQNFVLMTNYQRYVDGFFHYAQHALANGHYSEWVEPMDKSMTAETLEHSYARESAEGFQMPAYHLKLPDKNGITLINVGVGPSNMKTMTDHLAVLRPHCWLMLGHCAGLLHTQRLGDYVLANGYMRDDHVLDEELPLSIPIPPMAEIQQALVEAAGEFMVDLDELEMRRCLRSGTVLSTGNRNWELRIRELSRILNLSRALAVDMESATLAANAFRFSIPYGALLCVSDRPLHGELKLHGQARSFYQQRVQQHLSIGLRALEILRSKTMMSLHSRKLRGFQRTPFR